MKTRRRIKILEFLKGAARTGEEIATFFIVGSMSRRPGITTGLEAVDTLRRQRLRTNPLEWERLERKRVQRIIQVLKADGLISAKKQGRQAVYTLTDRGATRIKKGGFLISDTLSARRYTATKAETTTIIAYDIPNDQQEFRDWLRERLVAMDFTMLQRSVFIGKRQLPEEFIEDLRENNLLGFVEIFEITKKGTLRFRKQGQ